MKRAFDSVIAEPIGRDKPSTPRAIFAPPIAGTAAAALTYRALGG